MREGFGLWRERAPAVAFGFPVYQDVLLRPLTTMQLRNSPPDFSRNVHCVFGLPFDGLTEDMALQHLVHAAHNGKRCFLSTPNLSFAAGCVHDADFRQSVIDSDLSTPDGAPIVWLGRLMGAALPERVTGSNLFDRMANEAQPPVKVYLFGGPDGTAEQAAARLGEQTKSGVEVVGWRSPGFVPIDAMSGPAVTGPINAAAPQFVVVALGARKGQSWIARNWPQLDAPVISHLGAVINFVAGTVERAPRVLQRLGLEWLWRIKEEPELWRRYWNDGLSFLRYVVTGALPWALARTLSRLGGSDAAAPMTVELAAQGDMVALRGAACNGAALDPVRELFAQRCQQDSSLALDLRGLTQVGTGFVALLQLLDGWHRSRFGRGTVVHCSLPVSRALRWAGAGHVLAPATDVQPQDALSSAALRVVRR